MSCISSRDICDGVGFGLEDDSLSEAVASCNSCVSSTFNSSNKFTRLSSSVWTSVS